VVHEITDEDGGSRGMAVNRPFNCGFAVNSLFDITAGFRVLSEVVSLMMMFGVGASPC
jgi:hypothetical protein